MIYVNVKTRGDGKSVAGETHTRGKRENETYRIVSRVRQLIPSPQWLLSRGARSTTGTSQADTSRLDMLHIMTVELLEFCTSDRLYRIYIFFKFTGNHQLNKSCIRNYYLVNL